MSDVPEKLVCPYCGALSAELPNPCARCGMRDNANTRAATTARVGPWYVLQEKNPGAPGMNFATLLSLVRRGQVTAESVVRGPTTQQLWTVASKVKGLSREFSICWSCGEGIERGAGACRACKAGQEPPADPNALVEARPRERVGTSLGGVGAKPVGTELGLAGASVPMGPSTQSRILSPKELAAAFALEAPAGEGGVPVAGGDESPERPRRGGLGTAAWVVILLALAGLGTYLATDADARERVATRLNDWRDWAEARLVQPIPEVTGGAEARKGAPGAERVEASRPPVNPVPTVPKVAPAASPATRAAEVATVTAPRPATRAVVKRDVTPLPAKPVVATTRPAVPMEVPRRQAVVVIGPPTDLEERPTASPAPAQASARVAPASPPVTVPQATVPTPPVAPEKVVEKKPEAQAAVAATEPVEPAPVVVTPQMMKQAIDLFREALEAESRNDYAGAVELYKRIKELPEGAWPAILEKRLASAQLRAGDGL